MRNLRCDRAKDFSTSPFRLFSPADEFCSLSEFSGRLAAVRPGNSGCEEIVKGLARRQNVRDS
jgi:hypothetical protein